MNRRDRLVLIAGPCVIESDQLCNEVASKLKKLCSKLGITYIFKASYDKANRTSGGSFRGPGTAAGLATLSRIRERYQLPVLTDVHTAEQAIQAAEVCDVLQIPAFLCRQTDLINTAVATGKIVNIKKGQFLSPKEMSQVLKRQNPPGASACWLQSAAPPSATTTWLLTCARFPLCLALVPQ